MTHVNNGAAGHVNPTLAYSRFYGMSKDPFSTDELTQALFPGAQRQQTLDQLLHLSRYSLDLITITGVSGIGKTTLCESYIQQLDSDVVACRIQATLLMSATQLLEQACQQLGLDISAQSSADELRQQLHSFAESLQEDSCACLIVVDDAHELCGEALQILLDLALRKKPEAKPHVVLWGESQLHEMLQQSDHFAQYESQISGFELQSLDLEETHAYIMHRLEAAGFTADFPLKPRQVEKIFSTSGGVPRTINVLAREALTGIAEETVSPKLGLPTGHMTAIVVLLAALLLSFLYRGSDSESVGGSKVIDAGMEHNQKAAEIEALEQNKTPAVVSAEPVSEPEPRAVSASEPDHSPSKVDPPIISPIIDSAAISAAETSVVAKDVEAKMENEKEKMRAQFSLPPEPPLRVEKSSDLSQPLLSLQEQGLMALSPAQFTLQLLGSYSEQSVIDFVRQQGGGEEFSYFKTRYKSQPWYVVIYGTYQTREKALSAIFSLPKPLRGQKPWVRSLGSIQADIKKNNR